MTSSDIKKEYLFVYGTLRRDVKNQMWHVLARYAEYVGEGAFQGKLYDIGDYPGAVSSNKPIDIVKGEIYVLRDSAKVLKALDEYEGSDETPTAEFSRKIIKVRKEGKEISAWVYLYNHSTKGLKKISSGDYLLILPAYQTK
jgi:gamma-glutamylcyclotransferase (GGCT)/AIG2-like uncharacterized protein YtfP